MYWIYTLVGAFDVCHWDTMYVCTYFYTGALSHTRTDGGKKAFAFDVCHWDTMYVCTYFYTGALSHTRTDGGKKAFAFVDIHQYPHDSNLTMTVLLNVLERTYTGAKVLYVQLDNCARENKNKYLLGLCALLVEKGIFRKVSWHKARTRKHYQYY